MKRQKLITINWGDQTFRVPSDLSEAWDYQMLGSHTVARHGLYKLELTVNQHLGYVVWERIDLK